MAPAGAPASEVQSPKEAIVLTVNDGQWNPTGTTYNRQWVHCDANQPVAPISGATNKTYTVQSTDVNHMLCVAESAWNSAGNSQSVQTAATGIVAAAAPFAAATNSKPIISGAAVVGQTLTASTGNWRGTQPITYTYQWKRCHADGTLCGQSITGAPSSSPTYVVQGADLGKTLIAFVTASNSVGPTTMGSAPSAVVKATDNTGGKQGGNGNNGGNNNKGSSKGSSAQIHALLMNALGAHGAKIGALLKHGGLSFSVAAPSAGRLAIAWYHTANHKRILVATGNVAFSKAGAAQIKMLLTAKGRKLLRHSRNLQLTANGGFTPAGKGTTSASKRITLKR